MTVPTKRPLGVTLYRYYRTLHRQLAGDEHDLDQRFDTIMARIDAEGDRQGGVARRHFMTACVSTARRRAGEAFRGGMVAAASFTATKITSFAQGTASLALAVAAGSITAAILGLTGGRASKRPPHRRRREHNEMSAPSPQ